MEFTFLAAKTLPLVITVDIVDIQEKYENVYLLASAVKLCSWSGNNVLQV